MRPTRCLLLLAAALLLLAPLSALAGKNGPPPEEEGVVLDDPLLGDYFFHDFLSSDRIKTFVNVDGKGGLCVNIGVFGVDTTRTLNRRVEWEAVAFGTVVKQGPGKLQGEFPSVELTLRIFDGPEITNSIVFESVVAGAPCELDVKLNKVGFDFDADDEVGQIKANLVCELGPNLMVKGVPKGESVDIVHQAFFRKRTVKIKVKTGDMRVQHNGPRVDPVDDQVDFTGIDCLSNGPAED
jgi:hypothetical protein